MVSTVFCGLCVGLEPPCPMRFPEFAPGDLCRWRRRRPHGRRLRGGPWRGRPGGVGTTATPAAAPDGGGSTGDAAADPGDLAKLGWGRVEDWPDFTWFHLISPDFTWFHLIWPDLTWFHLISPDFTWFELISPDLICFSLSWTHFFFKENWLKLYENYMKTLYHWFLSPILVMTIPRSASSSRLRSWTTRCREFGAANWTASNAWGASTCRCHIDGPRGRVIFIPSCLDQNRSMFSVEQIHQK